jgi:DNA gyrase subunit A
MVGPGDEVILVTARGMAIRFRQSDSRPMGRNTSGVKGIALVGEDRVVGMVVADPEATLLTVCENGYGKRTFFGPNANDGESETSEDETSSSSARYRTQKRGGKGLRDIRTSNRNGNVIGIARVTDEDEIFMMTAKGKIQRIAAADINVIGRNTQGVRIMNVDDDDSLVAVVRVPAEEESDEEDVIDGVADVSSESVEPTDASEATDDDASLTAEDESDGSTDDEE